jgi:regulator of protease activity HflC (stomatin/prohibitin superfamily)
MASYKSNKSTDPRRDFILVLVDLFRASLSKGLFVGGGFFLLFAVLFLKPFCIVAAGERGVIMHFGDVQDTILGEGMHLIT